MLRQLYLRSRERGNAIKRDKYTCCKCGVKQSMKKGSVVKVQVHHIKGIEVWDEIIDLIYQSLLCDEEHLETLCTSCHDCITHHRECE